MKAIDRFSLFHDPVIHDRLNKMVSQLNTNFTEQEAAHTKTSASIASHAALITALTARIADLEADAGAMPVQPTAGSTPPVVTKKKPLKKPPVKKTPTPKTPVKKAPNPPFVGTA